MNDTLFIHSQDQLRELAQDVLRYAKDMGASDAAVQISEGSGLSVTVRRGSVETIEQNKDKGIGVTVYMGEQGAVRRGSASTSDFSQAALKATVEAACNIARFTVRRRLRRACRTKTRWSATRRTWQLCYPWAVRAEEAIALADPRGSGRVRGRPAHYQ